MDWLSDHAWQAWLAAAIALGVAELFSLDLILLMLAAGALVGFVLGAIGAPVALQFLAAAVAAAAALAFVRPSVVKRLHSGPTLRHGPAALIGTTGFALQDVSVHGGQVKLAGEVWTARPYDEDAVIRTGAKVEVYEIRGATAYVAEVPELER